MQSNPKNSITLPDWTPKTRSCTPLQGTSDSATRVIFGDSTRVTLRNDGGSIRVTINDSRLEIKSFLQNLKTSN